MGLFQEYVDSKGKIRKPVVDASGGDPDPKTPPTKPPKEHGNKPYAASDGKGPKNKCEKGFGDKGDKDLKIKFDPHSKGKAPAKIPTVEQVELAAFVAEVAKSDANFMERLVQEMKQQDLLGPLVAEMFQHKATYVHVSEMMKHESYGPEICNRLNRMMSEEVSPPFTNPST
jgi:hypothetical protein